MSRSVSQLVSQSVGQSVSWSAVGRLVRQSVSQSVKEWLIWMGCGNAMEASSKQGTIQGTKPESWPKRRFIHDVTGVVYSRVKSGMKELAQVVRRFSGRLNIDGKRKEVSTRTRPHAEKKGPSSHLSLGARASTPGLHSARYTPVTPSLVLLYSLPEGFFLSTPLPRLLSSPTGPIPTALVPTHDMA